MPRVKCTIRRVTTQQRRIERERLGRLGDLTVMPATLARYQSAVERFLGFLSQHDLPYPCTYARCDELVCLFFNELWEAGDPRGWASDVLSGLVHFIPGLRSHLNGAWRLHKAWGRAELPARAPPLSCLYVHALAAWASREGLFDTMILLLLGFHAYLRSGELFSLRQQCLQLQASTGRGVVSLPLTKSGQRLGVQESVTLDDAWLVRLCAMYAKRLQPGDFLSQVTPKGQRERLQRGCRALGLDHGYRWYSLRRGGATHDFRASGDLDAVTVRGRWGSQRTARLYLNDGLARLHELQGEPAARRRLIEQATAFRPGLSSLPNAF